jgi:hypothetical protein
LSNHYLLWFGSGGGFSSGSGSSDLGCFSISLVIISEEIEIVIISFLGRSNNLLWCFFL